MTDTTTVDSTTPAVVTPPVTRLYSPSTGCSYPSFLTYNPADIPTDCVPLSEGDFQNILDRPLGATVTVDNGTVQIVPYPGPSLSDLQTANINDLKAQFTKLISAPVPFTNQAGIATSYPAPGTMSTIFNQSIGTLLSNAILGGSTAWGAQGYWFDVNDVAQVFTFSDLEGLASAFASIQLPDSQELIRLVASVQAITSPINYTYVKWPDPVAPAVSDSTPAAVDTPVVPTPIADVTDPADTTVTAPTAASADVAAQPTT